MVAQLSPVSMSKLRAISLDTQSPENNQCSAFEQTSKKLINQRLIKARYIETGDDPKADTHSSSKQHLRLPLVSAYQAHAELNPLL